MTFQDLEITEPILKALQAQGYTHPTPIQQKAIPVLLRKRDLLGCAQTGTGKTAAFSVPILHHLHLDRQRSTKRRKIKALIVTPTRELAIQIGDNFTAYSKFTTIKNTVIFGGVKQGAQVQALQQGVDVLIATPGRLIDLLGQGIITFRDIEYFVLDEADRMLDMGFIHDIRKIIARLPEERQSLFFSATMPPDIVDLSRKILGNPEKVVVKPEQTTAEKVRQSIYFVEKKGKIKLLTHLLQTEPIKSVLVFSRTKHGANKIVKLLDRANIRASAIHGNKSQTARQKALNSFKSGELKVLVATDIAARGIDVEELSHVVNYDLPNVPETYVHRIGRTGRAGASGKALSFCDTEERAYLRDIQKTINQKIPVVADHPFTGEGFEPTADQRTTQQKPSSRPRTAVAENDNATKPKSRRPYWKKRRPQK
ncbi:DEAD/DEAH box helicase [Tunicatimonas pelagia]|uniref:DEAD/DEAH box helicase n=1 Tax=Tunicatimonas pelagia TaxID=931531 RepID=UPI00266688DB|nr:DEAD/DEAH box helicase [Tunicatimonas pelagia]WKN44797.1 DEAD/DEAH box helicase [Tunicatimonas pelagia]